MKVKVLQGNSEVFFGIGSELSESSEMTVLLEGIKVVMLVEKHSCGAIGESVSDTKGNILWEGPMNGCWQRGHQRKEWGDPKYAALFQDSTIEFV